jgi:DNA/RNA-binding domain of Phe-tRNA-synthetase-like protein
MPRELTLPDRRTLALDDSTAGAVLGGVVVLEDVRVAEDPAVWDAIAALAGRLRDRHAGRKPGEIDELQEARRLYNRFGMEPTRYRPSSEALLRRVLAGKDLYRINNAVDTCNLASLEFLLPIGMYDLDRIEGDVVLRVGNEGEGYPGIRKGPVNLAGRLGLFDDQGGFGSPTSDSARTRVTEATARILAVVMATAQYDPARMADHADRLGALFATHCHARVASRGLLGD